MPGGPGLLKLLAYLPMVLIAIAVLFTAVPLSFDAATLSATLPITVGSVVCIIAGEAIIAACRKKQ